ncbi:MAG: hypothetical protein ACREEU_09790 [Acetobacteraceae bacterium]
MRAKIGRTRRETLRLTLASAGLALLARTRPASAAAALAAEPFPNGVKLLVAGTPGEPVDGWANALTPVLRHLLPPETRLSKENAIGNDGVTGANQFAVRAIHDGATVLLVPGAAATAWLVGDPRVHFDAADWTPVIAGVSPGVVIGRVPMAALRQHQGLRIAATAPTGPELPALIAFELLGVKATPVFGLGDQAAAGGALEAGGVDLILLHGENVPRRMESLAAAGARALFSLGAPDAAGHWGRDPLLPGVPSFDEISLVLLGHPPAGPMAGAWRAAAAATMLDFALVLPQLTPADLVALWRNLGGRLTDAATVRGLSAGAGVRSLPGPAAAAAIAAVTADVASLLALRVWLNRRFGWRQT